MRDYFVRKHRARLQTGLKVSAINLNSVNVLFDAAISEQPLVTRRCKSAALLPFVASNRLSFGKSILHRFSDKLERSSITFEKRNDVERERERRVFTRKRHFCPQIYGELTIRSPSPFARSTRSAGPGCSRPVPPSSLASALTAFRTCVYAQARAY
jgi:hypothetical protein